MTYKIVEKKNHLAVHGIFDIRQRAERHLSETIPEYIDRGYFMDKTLTADDFEIIEDKNVKETRRRKRIRGPCRATQNRQSAAAQA